MGGSGSMELGTVRELHDALNATLFRIIGIATHGKGKHLCHGLYSYIMGWGSQSMLLTFKHAYAQWGVTVAWKWPAVSSFHDVLHVAVFRIIHVATQGKGKHL